MISVFMECSDRDEALAATLTALVPGAVEGMVSDVTLFDDRSTEAARSIADAAGCRMGALAELQALLEGARGDWVWLLEPGAVPVPGWMDHVAHHIGHEKSAVRFSCARLHRGSILNRLMLYRAPLALGLLLPKSQALKAAGDACDLAGIAKAVRARRIEAALRPASARA